MFEVKTAGIIISFSLLYGKEERLLTIMYFINISFSLYSSVWIFIVFIYPLAKDENPDTVQKIAGKKEVYGRFMIGPLNFKICDCIFTTAQYS